MALPTDRGSGANNKKTLVDALKKSSTLSAGISNAHSLPRKALALDNNQDVKKRKRAENEGGHNDQRSKAMKTTDDKDVTASVARFRPQPKPDTEDPSTSASGAGGAGAGGNSISNDTPLSALAILQSQADAVAARRRQTLMMIMSAEASNNNNDPSALSYLFTQGTGGVGDMGTAGRVGGSMAGLGGGLSGNGLAGLVGAGLTGAHFDTYQRLGTGDASLFGSASGVFHGASAPAPGLGGNLGFSSSSTLAAALAACRQQILPHHLGLRQQIMEEYNYGFPLSAPDSGFPLPGLGLGAGSLLHGQVAGMGAGLGGALSGNGLMMGGRFGNLAGSMGSPNLQGHQHPSMNPTALRGAMSADRIGLGLATAAAAGARGSNPARAATARGSGGIEHGADHTGDSATSKRLAPARGVFDKSVKTQDDMIDSIARANVRFYNNDWDGKRNGQRFRGYQCEQWTEKYNDLLAFKAEKGHCQVPHAFTENIGLARWVKRQRYQYKLYLDGKQSTMTAERVKLLEDIGFIWDSHAATWEERLNELKEYSAIHGDCNVPTSYSANPKLAAWIKCQRRQYKLLEEGRTSNMTVERMKELEKIGFSWRVQNAS